MQKRYQPLKTWLQHSFSSVETKKLENLAERMKYWKQVEYNDAVSILKQQPWPMCSQAETRINKATLAILHMATVHSKKKMLPPVTLPLNKFEMKG